MEAHAWQGQSEVARALAFFAPQQAWKLVESRSLIHSWRAHRPGEVRTGRMLGLLHVIPSTAGLIGGILLAGQGGRIAMAPREDMLPWRGL